MSRDPHDQAKLDDLGRRIAEARASQDDTGPEHRHHTDVGQVWRMVIELVTGIGVGFGIGYGLDLVFNTLPIFLVIFTLFGFAAGVRVMIGTAQDLAKAKEQTRSNEAADG